MGTRREGRIAALQLLYQLDTSDGYEQLDDALARFFTHIDAEARGEVRDFATGICRGVVEHRAEIDEHLDRASRNWRVARMSRVDRNVLRIAAYELMHAPEVPARVAINEAIEIGKRFGTVESSGFINGVLDRLNRALAEE